MLEKIMLRFASAVVGLLLLATSSMAQPQFSWKPINEGLHPGPVTLLWETPSGAFLAGSENMGIWRSTSYGAPWEPTSFGQDNPHHFLADSAGRVWLVAQEGLYTSTTDGRTWNRANFDGTPYVLVERPNGDLFVGAEDGIYRLQAGSSDWDLAAQWDEPDYIWYRDHVRIRNLVVLDDGTLVAAVRTNLLVSTDGEEWTCLPGDEEGCWVTRYTAGFCVQRA